MPARRLPVFTLRALRLRTRLALGFGLLLALMMAEVVLAVGQFRQLAAQGEQLMQVDLQRLLDVQRIHQHAQGHGNAMARLLTASRVERKAIYPAVDAEYAAVNQLLENFERKETDGHRLARLAEVERASAQYRDTFTEVVAAIEADEPVKARALFNGKGQQALGALLVCAKD